MDSHLLIRIGPLHAAPGAKLPIIDKDLVLCEDRDTSSTSTKQPMMLGVYVVCADTE